MAFPTRLYETETWVNKNKDVNRIQVVEIAFINFVPD